MQSILEVNQPLKSVLKENPGSREGLKLSDFSFLTSRKLLKNYRGSLSDVVIEDRKAY